MSMSFSRCLFGGGSSRYSVLISSVDMHTTLLLGFFIAVQSKNVEEFFGQRPVCLCSKSCRIVTNDGLRLVLSSLKRSVDRDHGLENLIGGEVLIDLVDADLCHGCSPVNLVDQETKELEVWIAVCTDIVDEVNGFRQTLYGEGRSG